jgi:hypothetical protein
MLAAGLTGAHGCRLLQASRRELDALVFSGLGASPLEDPGSCSPGTLAQLYVDGPTYSLTPAPANLDLSRRKVRGAGCRASVRRCSWCTGDKACASLPAPRPATPPQPCSGRPACLPPQVYDPAVSFATLAARAQARVAEVQGQAAEAAAIVLPAPLGSITLGRLVELFAAAAANASYLPHQADPALAPLNFTYDLATWQGNTTAYMQCSLDSRAPAYIGTCQLQNMTCVSTSNDTTPYNCTDLAGQRIAGNLSVVAYRWGLLAGRGGAFWPTELHQRLVADCMPRRRTASAQQPTEPATRGY